MTDKMIRKGSERGIERRWRYLLLKMLNVTVTKKTRRCNQGNILFTWSQPPSVHSLKEQALVDAPRSRGAAPLFDAYPAKKISPPSVCAYSNTQFIQWILFCFKLRARTTIEATRPKRFFLMLSSSFRSNVGSSRSFPCSFAAAGTSVYDEKTDILYSQIEVRLG